MILTAAAGGQLAGAQCPVHTMTSFERISGVTVNPSLLTILYTAPNVTQPVNHAMHHLLTGPSGGLSSAAAHQQQQHISMTIPITAECNNRCRRSARCRAFLVDYARHTCYSIDANQLTASGQQQQQLARQPTPVQLLPTQDRTSYFEKICLNLPAIDCERAWIYERVSGHHLHGHDDKIIDDVPSRLRCQEHCLNEREFKCRSGEYDYLAQQCRLSMLDRHVKPMAFRATGANVDYFENQCVPVGNQCDAFDRFEDLDLGRPEIMRSANTSDQCQLFCTQTIKAFVCRSFTWNPITGKCYLNSANTFTVGGLDKLIGAPGLIYYQRNDCIDLKLECDTNAMTLQLRTNEPFRGRMYVRDEPNLCETLGRSSLSSSLSIPFNHGGGGGGDSLGALGAGRSCAIRELPSRYSSVVVVQQHPLIQRKSDRYIKVVCDFQTANKTISSSYNVVANPWTSTALINATSFAPKIRLRITDRLGNDITGAKLGDELFLRIEAETESVYDMVARSVLAKSGQSDESIALIDKDGCPTDFRIFPPLKKMNRRTIVGKFDAFKFSSDVVVRFQVDVQFCLNQCPPPVCDQLQLQQQQLLLNAPAQLPSPNELGGVDNYSAVGSLRPSAGPTQLPSPSAQQQQHEVPSQTQQPPPPATFGSDAAKATTPGSLLMQQQQQSDLSLVSVLQQQAATSVPSSPASQLYPALLDSQSGLRMPANLLSSASFYSSDRPSNGQHQQSNSYQSVGAQGSSAGVDSQAAVTSDPQQFDASVARAKLDNSIPSASSSKRQQQQQQQRRRRRSAEPMPPAPRHIPLQREIIVESSGNSPAANTNKAAPADQVQKPTKSEGRSGGGQKAKAKTNKTPTSIDFVGSSAAAAATKANGLIRNGPAYDTFATTGKSFIFAEKSHLVGFCVCEFGGRMNNTIKFIRRDDHEK